MYMPINPLGYWSIKKLSIIWYGLPTLNSDMPCFWKAHFALAWTSLLGIFFPDALHLVLHFHRSASRLGMEQLWSFKPLILCLQSLLQLKIPLKCFFVCFCKKNCNFIVAKFVSRVSIFCLANVRFLLKFDKNIPAQIRETLNSY